MMRGKSKRQSPAVGTLVGADARVHGDIEFSGGLHIDGYVKGNVEAAGDAAATLSISERGCVDGVVQAPHVRLNGTVNGDVRAAERVELGSSARVIGNVQYKLIEMAVGAEVNGKLIHESEGGTGPQTPESAPEADSGAISSANANLVGEQ